MGDEYINRVALERVAKMFRPRPEGNPQDRLDRLVSAPSSTFDIASADIANATRYNWNGYAIRLEADSDPLTALYVGWGEAPTSNRGTLLLPGETVRSPRGFGKCFLLNQGQAGNLRVTVIRDPFYVPPVGGRKRAALVLAYADTVSVGGRTVADSGNLAAGVYDVAARYSQEYTGVTNPVYLDMMNQAGTVTLRREMVVRNTIRAQASWLWEGVLVADGDWFRLVEGGSNTASMGSMMSVARVG